TKKINMPTENTKHPDNQSTFTQQIESSFYSCFKIISKIILFPFNLVLVRLMGSLLAVFSIAILFYCFGHLVSEPNSSWFNTLTTGPNFFCQSLSISCRDQLGRIANTLSTTTTKASNVFESISHLNNPTNLEIYQTEIWELMFAIQYSSNLKDKDAMAEELWELGGMTGLLKDKVVELNGKVINSFSSVAHEDVSMLNCVWKFSRVAQVIQLVSDGKTSYSINTVERNFQLAFSNFNWELKRLINSIDNSIPPASRAANLGLQVSERIHKEHYKLKMFRDDQPLCRKLLHQTNKSGKQLKRDVQLTAR
ncbi:hypothetical protein MJO29_006555, partial [Puccinia striiformis f. sp. tritici]